MDVKEAQQRPSIKLLVGGESSLANQESEMKMYQLIKSDVLGYFQNFRALSPTQNVMLEGHLLQCCV